MSFLDAWSRWAAGDPTLRDAHLWGLTINAWGWISQIILGLGIIALILDVRASPARHRPRRQGMSALGWLQALVIGSLIFGAIIFGESPSGLQLVGVVLVMAAVIYATRTPKLTGTDPEPVGATAPPPRVRLRR